MDLESIEMKNSIISNELDRDLQMKEKELQEYNDKMKLGPQIISEDSEEDTIYESMMDIQLRKEDSKAFFENEIQGRLTRNHRRVFFGRPVWGFRRGEGRREAVARVGQEGRHGQ